MRGSIKGQTEALWRHSGVDEIGNSKHDDKAAARAAGATTASEIGEKTGVHGFATADAYRPTWAAILEHAKQNYEVRDAEKLTAEMVETYLRDRGEAGVSWAQLTKEASAANKLAVALERWSSNVRGDAKSYDFKAACQTVRNEFRDVLDRATDSRAYADPRGLIAALDNPDHRLTASLQLDAKLRISEATQIKEGQLLGERIDKATGQLVGVIRHDDAKGGKLADVPCRVDTYRALVAAVAAGGGVWRLGGAAAGRGHDDYRAALKAAAAATGQAYTGSHGLRYNGAQERYGELIAAGYKNEAALQQTSIEMTHERLSITRGYLK